MPITYTALIAPGSRPWHSGSGTIHYSFPGATVPAYATAGEVNGDGVTDWLVGLGGGASYWLRGGSASALSGDEQALARQAAAAWNAVANVHLTEGQIASSSGTAVTGSGALVTGLGGAAGFGETTLVRNDDGSAYVDLTSIFSGGLNFFGTNYTGLYVNTNGNVSFGAGIGPITGGIAGATAPMIAPFLADVDTRLSGGVTESGPIYVDLDTNARVLTVTWSQVGYFTYHSDKTDSFQLQLYDRGSGKFDIVFRYADINWDSGDADGGTSGVGGSAAHAGYTAGNGSNVYQIAASGNEAAMLGLESNPGNTGVNGLYVFHMPTDTVSAGDISIGAGGILTTAGGGGYVDSGLAAVANLPGTLDDPSIGGDIWINRDDPANAGAALGNAGWQTLLQGFGAALGLNHVASDGDVTTSDRYTVMSSAGATGTASYAITPMLEDIQAIQSLYGANFSTNSGDTTYFSADGIYPLLDGGKLANGQAALATIWDAGGEDTFDLGAQTGNMKIDLTPGHFSTIGQAADAIAVMTPVSRNGAVVDLIENAIGGSGNDTLIGNYGNNILSGGAGDDLITAALGRDRIDGGAGTDTLVLAGARASYLTANVNGQLFLRGDSESVLAANMETVRFTDATMSVASLMAASDAFDPLDYLATYSDLANAFGADAAAGRTHFLNAGFFEGRTSGTFDVYGYLASNPDLLRAYGVDFGLAEAHYILHGRFEGRSTTAFDPLQYLAANPDLIAAYGTDLHAATGHYLSFGFNENRPTGGFDALRYLASNDDLIRAFGDDPIRATWHYIAAGYGEGRPTTSFDPLRYLASNPDLARGYGTNTVLAEQHYIEHGLAEGRSTTSFDPLEYLATNVDLAKGYGYNVVAAETHYIEHGLAEGRASGGFDPVAYLLSDPDLAAAGMTPADALIHWITFGVNEGRPGDSLYGREQASHGTIVGGVVADTLETGRDRDWFGVTLAAGQHVSIDVTAGSFAPTALLADEHGKLLNAALAFLPGTAHIDFTADHAATYYLTTSSTLGIGGVYAVDIHPIG